jgi:toxin CptA
LGSHRRQPPLSLSPRFSPRLAAFVLLTHLLAAAAVLGLPGPWPMLLLPVAASLAYQLQVHVRRRAPWSIRSILWAADGTWRVALVSGREIEARLCPSTFVSVPLLVINLRSGPLRRWSLPLFADALDPEQLRRLRQRLRIEGTGSDRDAAPA